MAGSGAPPAISEGNLDLGNVAGLRAFGTVNDLELHCLAFLERPEPVALNGRVVHEDIAASVTLDESVPLGVVEPLDFSCDAHRSSSLRRRLQFGASLNPPRQPLPRQKKRPQTVRPFPFGARPARRPDDTTGAL